MCNVRKWVLVVAVLIVLLNIGVLVGTRCTLRVSQCSRVVTDIKTLKTCLMVFEGSSGGLPTKEEGLHALVANLDPVKFPRWQKLIDRIPLDPWGHEYQYIPPAPEGIRDYGIYSFGKDGISISNGNDPDDINSWDTGHRRLRSRPSQINLAVWIAIVGLCFIGSVSWNVARRARAQIPQ